MAVDLIWLYDGDHLLHPFIRQAAQSLGQAGYQLRLIDRSPNRGDGAYQHQPAGAGDGRLGRASFAVAAGVDALLSRPKACIATVPSAGGVAWAVSRLHKSRFIYYPFELYGEQASGYSPALKRIEAAFLPRVDLLITQNRERAQVYAERGARVEPVIVRNFKRARPAPKSGRLRARLHADPAWRLVLYQGQLVPGRGLNALVLAAELLPEDVRLVFMGRETPWWKRTVQPLLGRQSLQGRVIAVPFVPDSELLDYVVDADAGVIIYDGSARNNYFCEPGKLSDYVQARVPVVAPDFPTVAPLIRRYGIGTLFASLEPPAIAHAIREALALPRPAIRESLDRAARELVWETQEPLLVGAVSKILTSR